MKQVTLVMLYGPKPAYLSALITNCQERITQILGNCFEPYDIHQIHATLISLERVNESLMSNWSLERYRNQIVDMNISGMLNFLRLGGRFPFQVQIGGFENRDYPFVSQEQKPYDRSFSIVGRETAVALVVGWPIRGKPLKTVEAESINLIQEGRIYPTVLDEIRQSFQNFNILHRYHANPTDVDNDFYFRIGLIRQPFPEYKILEYVENVIRHFLSTVKPMIVNITLSDVYLALYQDETLTTNSTKVWSINDVKVTPEFIWSLYE